MTSHADQWGGRKPVTTDGALPPDSDYARYASDVTVWAAISDLASAATWNPGVHVVMLPTGGHVDLLFSGHIEAVPAKRALPVVFSGAVGTRQGTRAPFFSGTGLGRVLGTPLVAISDPLLASHDELKLGWYAGAAHEHLQRHIGEVLRVLSRRVDRELLLVGGSGGGFAALHQAMRIEVPVSALVWNPQTDVLDYDAAAVTEYLVAALGRTREQAESMTRDQRSSALRSVGIDHRVLTQDARAPSLRRLLYLQNASDWHVVKHLAPFLEEGGFTHSGGGRWCGRDGVMALVSALATGHSAPPRQVLEKSMAAMLDTRVPVARAIDDLQAAGVLPRTDLEMLPRDLRPQLEDVVARLGLRASVDHEGTVRASLVWDGQATRHGGITTVFEFLGADATVLAERAHAENSVSVPGLGTEVTDVTAKVRDGFRNPLLTLTERVGRLPRQVRVLVVGAAVSHATPSSSCDRTTSACTDTSPGRVS